MWPLTKEEKLEGGSSRQMNYLKAVSEKNYKINSLSHAKACDYLAQLF